MSDLLLYIAASFTIFGFILLLVDAIVANKIPYYLLAWCVGLFFALLSLGVHMVGDLEPSTKREAPVRR